MSLKTKKVLSFLSAKPDNPLKLSERLVLSFLAHLGKDKRPTNKAIAHATGLTAKTVAKIKYELQSQNLVFDGSFNPESQKFKNWFHGKSFFPMYVRDSKSVLSMAEVSVMSYLIANAKGYGNSYQPSYIAKVLGLTRQTVGNALKKLFDLGIWDPPNLNLTKGAMSSLQRAKGSKPKAVPRVQLVEDMDEGQGQSEPARNAEPAKQSRDQVRDVLGLWISDAFNCDFQEAWKASNQLLKVVDYSSDIPGKLRELDKMDIHGWGWPQVQDYIVGKPVAVASKTESEMSAALYDPSPKFRRPD